MPDGARDWGWTEWRASEVVTNELTGEIGPRARQYTELGDGMNYIDDAGQWRLSEDVVEATTNGAAALRGPTKVFFAQNLNSQQAVTLVTRSNTTQSLT